MYMYLLITTDDIARSYLSQRNVMFSLLSACLYVQKIKLSYKWII